VNGAIDASQFLVVPVDQPLDMTHLFCDGSDPGDTYQIMFVTMTDKEVNDLPEFDGF